MADKLVNWRLAVTNRRSKRLPTVSMAKVPQGIIGGDENDRLW